MFIQENLLKNVSLEVANTLFQSVSGIHNFIENEEELQILKERLSNTNKIAEEPDRAEYGDFQTNSDLANSVTKYLAANIEEPDILIEPTCGKGSFILAALDTFRSLKKVFGVEIYRPYVWQTKFSILNYFLENSRAHKPEIFIYQSSVFDFDFNQISSQFINQNVLIIGNPPWITNSMLGSLDSSNLPSKSNFKKHNGLDAITGKGNFDIAENITLMMIQAFQSKKGNLALLLKNSVIKNIVFDQRKNNYRIGQLEKHSIDSKKEFGASVDAALFFLRFNDSPSTNCKEFNFYHNSKQSLSFGWVDDKFVSTIETYSISMHIDGVCQFEWRQGVKHDCSSVMELEKKQYFYTNGLSEEADLEDDLIYGFIKSSDLKNTVIKTPRKYTIITQKKVGQDTSYIKTLFPKTYQYLVNHKDFFDLRKSSIYKDKPPFSIFGIGDYSFKPFKIAISGLYKTFHFTLVLPDEQKPLMLDDTCYMLGFDNLDYAIYTLILLNNPITKQFLQSITFPDSKRTFTKDVLMRIDLYKLKDQLTYAELKYEIESINNQYSLEASPDKWMNYVERLRSVQSSQLAMF